MGVVWLGLMVALVSFLLGEVCLASLSEFVVETWDAERGLPSSTVTGLAQSPDGYMWLSTVNGIARFDGVHFNSFTGAVGPGMIVGGFNQIAVDKAGSVWARSEGGEVLVREAAGFTAVSTAGKVVVARNLVTTSDGSLWATLANGAMARGAAGRLLDWPQTEKFGGLAGPPVALASDLYWAVTLSGELIEWRDGHPPNPIQAPGAGGMRMVRLAAESSGTIWLLGEEGLWNWQAGKWTPVALPRNATRAFQGISVGATGSCWIWSKAGAWRLDRGEWLPAEPAWAELMKEQDVSGSLVDDEGRIWFSTVGAGLVVLSKEGRLTQLSLKQGLPSNHVLGLLQDHEGTLWAATRRGLARIKQRQIQVVSWSEDSGESVATGLAEAADGTMWIGRDAGAVWRLANRGGAVPEMFAASPRSVRAMVFDRANQLWVGTVREGLWRVQQNHLVRVGEGQLPRDEARTLLADSQGRLWIGTTRGLFSLESDKVSAHPGPTGAGTLDVRALAEDKDGSIFIGTRGNGLLRWRAGEVRALEPEVLGQPLTIWALHLDGAGNLWIGTDGAGLLRWREGRLDFFSRTNGLPVDSVHAIVEGEDKHLWLGTLEGICRLRMSECDAVANGGRHKLEPSLLTRSDGMPTLQCASGFQPSAIRARDGRLWFSTIRGAVVVEPQSSSSRSAPPSVVIEDLTVQGQSMAAHAGVRLGPLPRRVEFHFTALSFAAPERVRFRYRLEGEDKDWIDAGSDRSVVFDSLQPGDHVFAVTACNSDGVWNEEGVRLSFYVIPIWWQTWWFKAGSIGGLLALIGGVWWWVAARRLQQRLEKLELAQTLERERARIARDIHDDLGAGLTQISMVSALARDTAPGMGRARAASLKVEELARDLVRSLDEIVWAVRPQNDNLESLVDYIGYASRDLFEGSGVRCWFSGLPSVPDMEVQASVRHNLLLACREALNNVLKHSRATEVRVGLRLEAGELCVEIADNGRGFELAGTQTRRNGLRNMQQRLRESGGECVIQSVVGRGTVVRFTLSLDPTKRRATAPPAAAS